MDTETNTRPVRKVVAIIGLIAVLVLIAWLSITIVKNVPGSFASLASLAESVRSFDAQTDNASDDEASPRVTKNMLVVTSDTNVIESDSNVRLSWTDASTQGTFVFSYECIDGVEMEIIERDGVRSIECDTNYNLGNINTLNLRVVSESSRFADIPYTLAFIASNETEPNATADAVITVVNEDIAITFADASDTEEATELTVGSETEVVTPTEETEPEAPVVVETEVEEPSAPTETTPTTETAGEVFTQEFTYTIPVSDPNGRIDLATRFLGTGAIVNNKFVAGPLEQGKIGAVQFEVKNLGTKTSEEWTYTVSLPAGGMVDSNDQIPLKPNERAVITIGFPATNIDDFDIVVTIDTEDDNTSLNNRFVKTVIFN